MINPIKPESIEWISNNILWVIFGTGFILYLIYNSYFKKYKCSNCGIMLHDTTNCATSNCNKTFCPKCSSKLSECKECNNLFCSEHIKDHSCQEEEEDESEEIFDVEKECKNLTDRQLLFFILETNYTGNDNISVEDMFDILKDIKEMK